TRESSRTLASPVRASSSNVRDPQHHLPRHVSPGGRYSPTPHLPPFETDVRETRGTRPCDRSVRIGSVRRTARDFDFDATARLRFREDRHDLGPAVTSLPSASPATDKSSAA